MPWSVIHDAMNLVRPAPQNLEPQLDIRPTTQQWVARQEPEGMVLDKMRWGLVPFWRSGKPLKNSARGSKDGFTLSTFNAKAETVATSRVFRGAFERRRCLVVADGWYEWTGQPGSKIKHLFTPREGELLTFAGIWDKAELSDVGEVQSFTIITQPAGAVLNDYHDRAPVVIWPEDRQRWLDPTQDSNGLLGPESPDRFNVAVAEPMQ